MGRNTGIHRLKDSQLRGVDAIELHDGGGLYFVRKGANSAHWYFRTRQRGMPTKTGLGPYPAVSLSTARVLASECKVAVAAGGSPKDVRSTRKPSERLTFAECAKATYESKVRGLRGRNKSGEWLATLEQHTFAKLGKLQCRNITVPDIVAVLKPLWIDHQPTAAKVKPRIKATLKWAQAHDPAVDITLTDKAGSILGAHGHKVRHHDALNYIHAPKLYKDLTDSIKHLAFKFYLLTLPRIAPVRKMVWGEVQGEAWVVPGENMKSGEEFIVPLSPAAVLQLELARQLTKKDGPDDLVFPNPKAFKKGMVTENEFNMWFKAHGVASTGHGLRSTFFDWAEETRACEYITAKMALDHKVKTVLDKSYWHSDRFLRRLDVMGKWGAFVSGGASIGSPHIIRADEEGNDESLSIFDLKMQSEESEFLERQAERNDDRDSETLAKWYRDTDTE